MVAYMDQGPDSSTQSGDVMTLKSVSFAPVAPIDLWNEYRASRGLTDEVLAPLNGSLLTIEQACKVVGQGLYGFKADGAVGAYVYPIAKDAYQARVLYRPEPEIPGVTEQTKPRKRTKYYIAKGSANPLAIPPHVTDWYADTKYNLLLVEGMLNAVRLASEGLHAVAITGVNNYRTGPKGTPIIPELKRLIQSKQAERVTILFDSDTNDPETKQALWNAIHTIAQEFMRLRSDRRDTIYICRPPAQPDGEKNGPDDYLHQVGLDEFNKLLREQSAKYADHPYLQVEGAALARFIFEEWSGTVFDTKLRISTKMSHFNSMLATYGAVEDITANRPTRILYSDKRFLAAGPRIAQGSKYQPDVDDIFFPDETEEPPRYYINTFQPEDVPKAIKGDVSIAYRMMESICRNTPSAVQKLMTIAAKHAQFPALLPKYGVLMTGQQGSGKSTLSRLIGLALSKRYNSDKVNLGIDFNKEWRGFACKEWPEFDKGMDEEWLKDLITGDSYLVSVKYGTNYREKNHTLNIFTCNGLQAKIQEGDRRFLVCGDAKSDDKKLGLEFEAWVNGMGPNHFRYHLLNDIDCSVYDLLDVWTEMKDAVIEASKSYKATVKDYVIEECEQIEGLECIPNVVLQSLLDVHRVNAISFNKEFGQTFVKPAREMVKVDGFPHRFRAFKNHEYWRKEDNTEEYVKQFRLAQKLLASKKF
jgi:energy-coupling factor transporter ATP-binding protein EcfA2